MSAKERNARYYAKNKEKVAAYHREWYAKNREKALAYSEQRRKNFPEKAAARTAAYRQKHPEKIAAYKASEARKQSDAKYREQHGPHPMNQPGTDAYAKYRSSEKYRVSSNNAQLMREYGITYAQYLEMLSAQGGVCKICLGNNARKSQRRELRPLFVDHCHSTNKVRGLLCALCNYGIGAFKENVSAMKRAIVYLEEN